MSHYIYGERMHNDLRPRDGSGCEYTTLSTYYPCQDHLLGDFSKFMVCKYVWCAPPRSFCKVASSGIIIVNANAFKETWIRLNSD